MPREIVLFQLLPLPYRKLVAAVIIGVLGVALDPVGMDLVLLAQVQERLPEVGV